MGVCVCVSLPRNHLIISLRVLKICIRWGVISQRDDGGTFTLFCSGALQWSWLMVGSCLHSGLLCSSADLRTSFIFWVGRVILIFFSWTSVACLRWRLKTKSVVLESFISYLCFLLRLISSSLGLWVAETEQDFLKSQATWNCQNVTWWLCCAGNYSAVCYNLTSLLHICRLNTCIDRCQLFSYCGSQTSEDKRVCDLF